MSLLKYDNVRTDSLVSGLDTVITLPANKPSDRELAFHSEWDRILSENPIVDYLKTLLVTMIMWILEFAKRHSVKDGYPEKFDATISTLRKSRLAERRKRTKFK